MALFVGPGASLLALGARLALRFGSAQRGLAALAPGLPEARARARALLLSLADWGGGLEMVRSPKKPMTPKKSRRLRHAVHHKGAGGGGVWERLSRSQKSHKKAEGLLRLSDVMGHNKNMVWLSADSAVSGFG